MKILRYQFRTIVAAFLLGVAMALPAFSQPDPATAPAGETGPAPTVVRQSTPIPNDPEVKPKPKRIVAKPVVDSGNETEPDMTAAGKPPSHRCFVRDIMAFYDRTHVRCYNKAKGKYTYFAVDTGQPVAETLLSKAWKSMRSGKPLTITYAPTPDLNPTNCAPRDCRRLIDVLN